jgi:mutator protein MutT
LTPSEPSSRIIHVVAAAVTDADGRVLIAQRPPGKHLAGSWEFPGGKLESGESRAQGLARELEEELGITIRCPRPLIRVRHTYPYGEVLIDMWVVSRYDGEPRGLDGQELRWCAQDGLATADLLPADRPIVRALRLPERLTEISTPYYRVECSNSSQPSAIGADGANDARLRGVSCASVAEAVAAAGAGAGADFLALNETLSPHDIAALCESVSVPVYARGLALEEAWILGASGLSMISQGRV